MSTHIGAKPGEIAKGILLPGDPMRAKYIAENFLENPVCFNNIRNMLGFTGTYKGKRVSVMGTGMGIPSISIYVNELISQYGVENLIRVGTCGAMQPSVKIEDVIIAEGASTKSDFNRLIFPGTYCPVADFDLLRTAYLKTKELGMNAKIGNICSGDMFYGEKSELDENWEKYGILGGEMEAAALFTIAKKFGVRALAMAMATDSRFEERIMTSDERERSVNKMVKLALETVVEFI